MSKPVSLSIFTRSTLFSSESFNWSAMGRSLKSRKAFLGCLLFIVGVSIYDSYLVALYPLTILEDERNPICKMLIQKDPLYLSWFLAGKFIGNLIVVGSLALMSWIGYRRIMAVTFGVTLFQAGLLAYLTLSDPLTGVLHFGDLFSHDPARAAQALKSLAIHMSIFSCTVIVGGLTVVGWRSKRGNLNQWFCAS